MRWLILIATLFSCAVFGQSTSAQAQMRTSLKPQATVNQMDVAHLVEEAVQTLRNIHDGGGSTGLPERFHYHIKQWTQRDVTDFATYQKTFTFFETLLGFANVSVERDAAGQATQDALDAQGALTYLKPDCCKSWKGFAKMIGDAAEATQAIRDEYRRKN
jgi:hypothetical protein